MRQLGPKQLKNLLLQSGEPCVSMYVSPSTGHSRKPAQLPLQSQLSQVRALLHKHYPGDAGRLLGPLAGLVEQLQEFHLPTGLAIFKSSAFEGVFSISDPAVNRAVVADSFHIRPILASIQRHDRYTVVALKDGASSCFEGSAVGVQPVANLSNTGPVILVGAQSLREQFLETTKHVHHVIGGVDLDGEDQQNLSLLYQKTWCIHHRWMQGQTSRDIAEYRLQHRKGLATDNLYQVAIAAKSGRVKSLMLEKDVHILGRINPRTGQPLIEMQDPESKCGPVDDILDDLAELVLASGGHVRVVDSVDMPSASPLAATLLPRSPVSWFKSIAS